MKRILYVAFDQLHQKYGALATAKKEEDLILLIESQAMIGGADWHPERLFFLISSARHFAQSLADQGFSVRYLKAANTAAGIDEIKREYPKATLIRLMHLLVEEIQNLVHRWINI